ncbi:type IV pilus twitching motility protein PilT [Chromobacterium amazonense]|uniref:type IV pilus twitching motility protein PilT n=1 Tax=Chromobacterium amazonense TaxID=1382803 RepID=UPI003F79A182
MLSQTLATLLQQHAALADFYLQTQRPLSFVAAQGRVVPEPALLVSNRDLESLLGGRYPNGNLHEALRLLGGVDDFRLNLGGQEFRGALRSTRSGGALSLTLRRIRPQIPAFEGTGLPLELEALLRTKDGLILFTGPTGSGKSTSMASCAQRYAQTFPGKIVTFEDPIEYQIQEGCAAVDQHEIGTDVASFIKGLMGAMRESPTMIIIGEIRDAETLQAALQGAETGHLVLASLHTNNFAATVDRVCDLLSGPHVDALRKTFAGLLRAVVSQQLLPAREGEGRVLAHEVVVPNPAIINTIRKGELQILQGEIEKRLPLLHSLNDHLAELVREGKVTAEAARQASYKPEALRI